MKKICSLIMSVLLIAMFSIPAGAIETNLTQEEAREAQIQRYAYMDLDHAAEADKSKILQAREEIIYGGQGWYSEEAGAVSACLVDKNGSVIEELPEFYEIFPEDWDVPCSSVEPKADDELVAPYSSTYTHYNADVYLYKPGSTLSSSFCTFSILSSSGYPEVRAKATRLFNSASYNIGFTNADNGKNLSFLENLPAGNGLIVWVDPAIVHRMGARASTNSTPGNSRMLVQPIYP